MINQQNPPKIETGRAIFTFTTFEHARIAVTRNTTITTNIIRTVVRIVGMGRMSHICNTKCSRL